MTPETRAVDGLRQRILALVTEYHRQAFAAREFVPGQTPVLVSGRTFDDEDMRYLVDSALDFWLTTGRFAKDFERELAKVFGLRAATLVNSGSSANLLAMTALTARELKLLQLFHAHPGEVLSRDRLLNEVWGINYYGTTRTLDQVIVQLRKKLGDNGDDPKHLLTVHGVGYKLVL